ncbi:hypothetical protein ACUXCC_003476 [Cytobacillus horneckiae]|uniref:phage tail tube protein n=1 Tax=Cytobacillus horneckiae TaxID=549687 RepID=UPI0019D0AF10|nr:capsid protein [Cytobacillus horneckiae]MBN6889900.1 capsid protein [Cytobacillus horneckiae]
MYHLNYLTQYKIGATKEELHPLAAGISTVDPSSEESTEDYAYYDGNGGSEEVTTGLKTAYAFSGNRKYADDPAQELIRNKLFKINEREVYFQVTEPDGRVIEGPATLKDITPFGGDANARATFEFTVTFRGIPTDKPAETPAPPSGE